MVKMQIEMATQRHDREMASRRQEIEADSRRMQADIDDRYQQRKLKLEESLARMSVVERLVSKGLDGGQADASVLKTMLEQSTEQEYATTSDAMVTARAEGNAGATNVETYRAAAADERVHQVAMTQLSANMMAAAKQSPAPVIMPGGAVPTADVSVVPIKVNVPSAVLAPAAAQPAIGTCPDCGFAVQAGWKVCPRCTRPL